MCFIPLNKTVFDVYGMNPLKIKILLTHDFAFYGFFAIWWWGVLRNYAIIFCTISFYLIVIFLTENGVYGKNSANQ